MLLSLASSRVFELKAFFIVASTAYEVLTKPVKFRCSITCLARVHVETTCYATNPPPELRTDLLSATNLITAALPIPATSIGVDKIIGESGGIVVITVEPCLSRL